MLKVPDIEGSNESRCELTRTPYGRRFISEVGITNSLLFFGKDEELNNVHIKNLVFYL